MTSQTFAPGSLRAAIQEARLHPLWEFPRTEGHQAPNRVEPAVHWKWEELASVVSRTASEVGMDEADRRVLLLANPHLRPAILTTTNLQAAVQILEPGDRAVEHRHSPAAIRLIVEAEGGWTSVDGVEQQMSPGDFILTPSMTWHGHANTTSSRVIWIDGLDAPFVRSVDAAFFEPPRPGVKTPEASRAWPQVRYPWKDTSAQLARQAPEPDGSVKLRYVHPATGGAVMPTLDCYVQRLARGRMTTPQRSTSNAVCVVMSGEGTSRVGRTTVQWKERDIFTIPHWSWSAHQADSPSADLFFLTDRELYQRLGLLRDETAPAFPD